MALPPRHGFSSLFQSTRERRTSSPSSAMANCNPPTAKKPLVSVFDWDDTLCPTSWLHDRGLLEAHGLIDGAPPMETETSLQRGPVTSSDRQRLEQLELQVLQLLQLAAHFGPVFIVTAASLHWVVASAEHFLPRLRQFLLDNQHQSDVGQSERVQVVSARDWYQQHVGAGGSQLDWKFSTFEALCKHLKVQDVFARLKFRTDLVSVGDSRFEQEASVRMEMQAPLFLRSKTLKLVDRPALEELLGQLRMTREVYERVCQYDSSLHLCVVRKEEKNSVRERFGESARVIEDNERVLGGTMQLVQIDNKAALEGPTANSSDIRLQQLLAAADSMCREVHLPVTTSNAHDCRSSQEGMSLPAVS